MNLGEILIEQGLLSEDELRIVLREQTRSNQPFGKVCRNMGLISNRQINEALSRQYRMPILDAFECGQAIIDEATARKFRALPTIENGELVFAIEDPTKVEISETLKRMLPEQKIQLRLADSTFIEKGFGFVYGDRLVIDHLMDSQNENRFVEMVDRILAHAVRAGVSDIHFIPHRGITHLCYRIDGFLQKIKPVDGALHQGLVSTIKVMSGCDIGENRSPQDGRLSKSFDSHDTSFRTSIIPTLHGESVVIRILPHGEAPSLEKLSLSNSEILALREIAIDGAAGGLTVTSGPTGSGKTTLMAAMIADLLKTGGLSAISLEDPPEYQIPGVRQTAVNDKLSWALGLRGILRHDPDVIVIGEIRDSETAHMAIKAALTGHRVFSTIHANSVSSVKSRFLDFGVSESLFDMAVVGMISQRLLRKICHCVQRDQANGNCHVCKGVGLAGRVPLVEIRNVRKESGDSMRTMLEQANALVDAGVTSSAEIERVLGVKL